MNRPIGIFDSGVGGLTVLTALKDCLPNENLIYIGDNIHCPYGDKTKAQLLSYTKEICQYFISQNAKMIVLACNTTSANVLDELQALYPQVPIVGVIHSTVHDFLCQNKKSVLVIATNATIQSHKYKETILKYNPSLEVYELATPKIVPLIESGEYKQGIEDVLLDYLKDYETKIDCLILGCTHYPIITNQFESILKDKKLISSSLAICQEVASYLKVHDLLNASDLNGDICIYTTGNIDEFRYSSEGFFDYHNLEVQSLKL